MILIQRNSSDPFFNIAAEEYFLKNFTEEIVMIWGSIPSVIVGKHQNTMAEVNVNFVNENNIPVIRRISGGGTVYHDEGNINYSIITRSDNRERLVDFIKFTQPLIAFLATMGITANFEGKNNLTVDGKKFSGNSAHVYKNRVLHHGTLLFKTNLDNLEKSITPGNFSISDKAVKSIRADVTNLSSLLPANLTLADFTRKLITNFKEHFRITTDYHISEKDSIEIINLVESKYKLWDWNFGYSPTFQFNNVVDNVKLSMKVIKGIINDISIEGEINNKVLACNALANTSYKIENIELMLSNLGLSKNSKNQYLKLFGYQSKH